ncbi:MAG: electron transport complex subunit RsxE [Pseudomonadota bacterium]
MSANVAQRLKSGLWQDNPGLVQLLGLPPLLAVTTSFVNGLGLGLATLTVLVLSNVMASATRGWLAADVRVPAYVLIIASLVTCIELIFKAWFPALDNSLGIFIPLIVANGAIIARAETFASHNNLADSIIDGVVMGLGFAMALMALGFFRELFGQAQILGDLDSLFRHIQFDGIQIADQGFLLLVLPPGAFITLALAIAAKKALDRRKKRRA